MRELDFIYRWLPPTAVRNVYLPATNGHPRNTTQDLGKGRKRRRRPVDETEFYQFIITYFVGILARKGRLAQYPAEYLAMQRYLMGKVRFAEIFASCRWTPLDVRHMHEDFNHRVPLLLKIGSVLVIDETLLAYFGTDALREEILRHIKPKPHDFGLLGYRVVVRLRHSGARVVLVIVPVVPDEKWTPTTAALKMINILREISTGSAHYVMDSAFATVELIEELRLIDAAVSLSLKENRTAGFAPIYQLATTDLREGEVRSYQYQHFLFQARRKASTSPKGGSDLHVVLSTGWRTADAVEPPIKRLFKFKTARNLYLDEDTQSLAIAFSVNEYKDKRDLILHALGWDVLAPPPNRDGRVVWNREGLLKMKVDLLRDLHVRTKHCKRSSSKDRGELVEDLMEHHPALNAAAPLHLSRPALPKDIIGLRQHVGLELSDSAPILDFYSSEYGAVDEVNQEIYRSILLNCHRSWERLLGFSVIHALCMNAWAECEETRVDLASHDRQGRRLPQAQVKRQCFSMFMFAAAQQWVAGKK